MNSISKLILNNKNLTKNISGVILLKGASMVLTFIMTPMYLSYFKDQRILGVWYTLQSVLLWILTFDLGVGNGIRNRLAEAIARDDERKTKEIISSGYIVFGAMSVCVVIVLAVVIPIVNWEKTLNTNISTNILDKVLLTTLIGIVLQFFFKIVTSILMALRKNILANSLAVITNFLILCYLFVPINASDDEKFTLLAMVYTVATILPPLITTIYIFTYPLKTVRPSIKYWNTAIGKAVFQVGGGFFLIQLGLLVINSTNQFLINSLFGGAAVVEYTLYYRLYSTASMVFTLFTQPVWSEISIHYAKGDMLWIRKIYHFMLFIAALIGIGCLVVTGGLQFVFRIWLGEKTLANGWIGLLYAIWSIVEVFTYAGTCIANGMTKLKCQMYFTLGAAIAKIPVTFFVAKGLNNWISVVIAHIVVILPLMVAQNFILFRQLQKNLELSR